MSTLIGQTLHGYQFREIIGQGGYGHVYLAYQPALDRQVAIKVILPQYTTDPKFKERFEREARTVASLESQSPRIVPLYDYWQDDSGAYLVMRYIKGSSLRELLKKKGKFNPQETADFLDQLADALAAAHRNDVIHRDIKPENILLDENGNLYLGDFGIARDISQETGSTMLTSHRSLMGTPGYASPEQISNKKLTKETDVYSLGIMLYEMLTGQRPFKGDDDVDDLEQQLGEGTLPSLRKQRLRHAVAMDVVLRKAAAKKPSARYQNVRELAQDFRNATRGQAEKPTIRYVLNAFLLTVAVGSLLAVVAAPLGNDVFGTVTFISGAMVAMLSGLVAAVEDIREKFLDVAREYFDKIEVTIGLLVVIGIVAVIVLLTLQSPEDTGETIAAVLLTPTPTSTATDTPAPSATPAGPPPPLLPCRSLPPVMMSGFIRAPDEILR